LQISAVIGACDRATAGTSIQELTDVVVHEYREASQAMN
jgi:hypothetical protein